LLFVIAAIMATGASPINKPFESANVNANRPTIPPTNHLTNSNVAPFPRLTPTFLKLIWAPVQSKKRAISAFAPSTNKASVKFPILNNSGKKLFISAAKINGTPSFLQEFFLILLLSSLQCLQLYYFATLNKY